MSFFFLDREGQRQLREASAFWIVGPQLVISILIGFFGGRWLDQHFETAPYLQWLGFGLGFAAGLISFYQAMKIAHRRMNKPPSADDEVA